MHRRPVHKHAVVSMRLDMNHCSALSYHLTAHKALADDVCLHPLRCACVHHEPRPALWHYVWPAPWCDSGCMHDSRSRHVAFKNPTAARHARGLMVAVTGGVHHQPWAPPIPKHVFLACCKVLRALSHLYPVPAALLLPSCCLTRPPRSAIVLQRRPPSAPRQAVAQPSLGGPPSPP